MTPEQLQCEFRYRVALALVHELLRSRVITSDDYVHINERLIQSFHPVLKGLYPQN